MINSDDKIVCSDLEDYLPGMTVKQAADFLRAFDESCRIETKKDGPAFQSFMVIVRPCTKADILRHKIKVAEEELVQLRRDLLILQRDK